MDPRVDFFQDSHQKQPVYAATNQAEGYEYDN